MTRMISRLFGGTLGLGLATTPLAVVADWVQLDNGDRLSGRIAVLTNTELKLETPYAGLIALPRERLRAIHTDTPVRIRLADGTEFDGQLRSDEDDTVRIRIGRLAETASLPIRQVAAINPPDQSDVTAISARLSAGGSMSSGNTDAQTLHLSGEMIARNAVQRVTLDAAINSAEQSGVQTTSNARMGLKYDHFVASRAYLYVNTRFEHDGEADLDLRSALGVGGGWQIADEKTRSLAVEGGLSFISEDYGSAPDQRFPGARLALKAERSVWNERVRLFHDSDLLVSLESLDDILLRTRTGVRVPVATQLSLGTSFHYDYDTVPAPGKKKTDTALIFQVDYAL